MPVPDWAGRGDDTDEWIELYNSTTSVVDLSGWFLDDSAGGSEPYLIPEGTRLGPRAFILFYGEMTGIALDDAGDQVRLIDAAGLVTDSVIVGPVVPEASYSRDEAGIWHDDWPPSPGVANLAPGAVRLSGRGPGRLEGQGIHLPVGEQTRRFRWIR